MTEIEQAVASLKHLVECRCDEAYTGRDRHDPHSSCDYADEVKIVTDHIAALTARVQELEGALSHLYGQAIWLRGEQAYRGFARAFINRMSALRIKCVSRQELAKLENGEPK